MHLVGFDSPRETIELRLTARNRNAYATGIVAASARAARVRRRRRRAAGQHARRDRLTRRSPEGGHHMTTFSRSSRPRLRGALTALVTPFTAYGTLDEEALRRVVRWQVLAGIDGLVPCGTTGEA